MNTKRVDSMISASVSGAAHDTASAVAAAPPPPPAPAAPTDRVSMDQVGQVKTSVEAGMTMAAGERSERLHVLAQAVRSGTYRPNVHQLAAQILAEAELDAKLARM